MICRAAGRPSMPGIRQSMNTTSYGVVASCCSHGGDGLRPELDRVHLRLEAVERLARISRAAALSSTTSARNVWQAPGYDPAATARCADAEPDGERNVLPTPASLSSQIWPPISSTSRRQIVSPRPVPPCLRVVDMSAWVNGWNSFAACSRVMPMPVSRTENLSCTFSPVRSQLLDFEADLAALGELHGVVDQVGQDLASRSGSPSSCCGMSGATSARNSRPLSCAFWAVSVVTELMTSSSRKSVVSMSSLPASIFEKSRMSLMIASSEVPALWTLLT